MDNWAWAGRIDWRLRSLAMLTGATGVASLALAGAGVWHNWWLALPAVFIVAACLTCMAFSHGRNWLGRMDWRIGAILLATAASVALTLIGFDLGLHHDDAQKFLHEVFAGWVGGVGFFGMVGVIVAVVSVARPQDERFENRARILFRGPDGKHVDYIVERIRSILEHYSEEIVDTITVDEYDKAEDKFFSRPPQLQRSGAISMISPQPTHLLLRWRMLRLLRRESVQTGYYIFMLGTLNQALRCLQGTESRSQYTPLLIKEVSARFFMA